MEFLTTPNRRFENLIDYPFEPNYAVIENGLQMHYVEEGPRDGAVVLLLHGEPSWSFLYRKMIPIFAKAGYRTIAPDLIGFGKSSKPTKTSDYTYQKHVNWMKKFIHELGLEKINLFCQDWGGLIGLRIVGESPDLFQSVIAANTVLPTGDQKVPEVFQQWQTFSQIVPEFPVGLVLQGATTRELSPEEIAAYRAPFPEEKYKAGARIFPSLVPTTPENIESENNKKAWENLKKFEKPFLTLFSDKDPVTKGVETIFQKLIPGTKGQPHKIIKGGGHFLQEDCGVEIAELVVDFLKLNS